MSAMGDTVDPPSPGSRLDADHPENGGLIPCRITRKPNIAQSAERQPNIIIACDQDLAVRIPGPQRFGRWQQVAAVDRHGDRDAKRLMHAGGCRVAFGYGDFLPVPRLPQHVRQADLSSAAQG
jgi:hypothetical protein